MRKHTSPWAAFIVAIFLTVSLPALTTGQARPQSTALDYPAVAPPPHDPFELVTTQPQPAEKAKTRNADQRLLERILAKRLFGANGVPYTVNISFTAGGEARETGPGEMEETRNVAGVRRWTGRLGNYSITRIIAAGTHDVGSPGPIPMRLQMAREYVGNPPLVPMKFIRTAEIATSNGDPVVCILGSNRPSVAPGRDWSETEYCIDPKSQLLRVYSPAPGIYVVYDYTNSSFHGRVVPDQVTITEAGQIVLQGSIRVTEPDSLDPVLFIPTRQMATDGIQFVGGPPIRPIQFRETENASGVPQPIVVHAILSPDGSVVEAEALQSADLELSRSAVELVKKTKYGGTTRYSVPPQLEIFVTVL